MYTLLHNILNYLLKEDTDPVIRLYIPEHIRNALIIQFHENNGHTGIDKTYDAIKGKYYWPNMYKELYKYVSSCVTCLTSNVRKVNPPQQDTPPFAFAKLGLDVSGPYHLTNI